LEHRIRRVDGSLGWTFSRAVPLLDANGEILEWFGAASDVTERHQAEEALRESEQRLRYLASQILSAQEQERKRISMDLHEGLGQSMTALKMYLRAIQKNLPAEAPEVKEDFEGSQNLLKEMVEEVRRISRGLSPAILENIGLGAAFKRLLKDFGKYHEVEIKVDVDDIRNLFSPQTEVNLFRIFQESLNNIAKHAYASQVAVTIARQNGTVYFSIKDNGVGFDLTSISRKDLTDKGMGLAAMEERLRMIGTQLNIFSQKGTGTEISFSIPIDAACLIRE
jgi:signal transduction histidine kinase